MVQDTIFKNSFRNLLNNDIATYYQGRFDWCPCLAYIAFMCVAQEVYNRSTTENWVNSRERLGRVVRNCRCFTVVVLIIFNIIPGNSRGPFRWYVVRCHTTCYVVYYCTTTVRLLIQLSCENRTIRLPTAFIYFITTVIQHIFTMNG